MLNESLSRHRTASKARKRQNRNIIRKVINLFFTLLLPAAYIKIDMKKLRINQMNFHTHLWLCMNSKKKRCKRQKIWKRQLFLTWISFFFRDCSEFLWFSVALFPIYSRNFSRKKLISHAFAILDSLTI